MKQLKSGCSFSKAPAPNNTRLVCGPTYVIVALHGVDEGLVGHDLRLPAEEGLEAFFHRLQLLFADLRDTNTQTSGSSQASFIPLAVKTENFAAQVKLFQTRFETLDFKHVRFASLVKPR